MKKENISREKLPKTGIKAVILGYQSILDTISEKIGSDGRELRERIASEFPNIMKPLLKTKGFALYDDDNLHEIRIFKNESDRDIFIAAAESANDTHNCNYKTRPITLDEVFEIASKSWKDPMNYTVYTQGADIELSLYDDRNDVKTTNGGI